MEELTFESSLTGKGIVERVLFVVYTERGGDNIRIISARRATPKEEKEYYENYDIR